jgi:hypothetical protein
MYIPKYLIVVDCFFFFQILYNIYILMLCYYYYSSVSAWYAVGFFSLGEKLGFWERTTVENFEPGVAITRFFFIGVYVSLLSLGLLMFNFNYKIITIL